MPGQKIDMGQAKQKYVFVGDGESVHLLKWLKEMRKYFQIFVISSRGFLSEIEALIPQSQLFALGVDIKQEGLSLGYLSKILRVKHILKEIKPDFVNAHYISSNGLLVTLGTPFSKPSYTFIASAWGTDVLVFPWKNKVFFTAMTFVLKRADWITSDSDYMSSVIRKIRDKKVLTFTFGLDSLPTYDDGQYDEHLYFSNRALSKNYHIDRVIRVFYSIYQQDPLARLIISNVGDEKEELMRLCEELNITKAVSFAGFLNAVEQAEIYKKSCCYFSLPSSDSTSVSLLEALAYGCLPLLSDIPANREWIKDSENGLLIGSDISYSKLQKLQEKRKDIVQANRKIIKKRAIFPNLISTFVHQILSKQTHS
jgi:glycosyltransferase involved in cell wall biosynthesis